MKDNAIGVYSSRNLESKLTGCNLVKVIYDEIMHCDVVIFFNEYRKVFYDVFFTSTGVMVSDAYGIEADRNELTFVRMG